jgi:TetR/AcrR family hemagglutinin/protease transcriptional regulator
VNFPGLSSLPTALVKAVLDEVERFYLVMAERIHAQDLPAPRVLLEHARAFAASVTSQPDHARVWLDWSTAIRDGVWPRYLEFQDRMLAILERTVRRGQVTGEIAPDLDAGDEARLLVGSAHMIAQMQFTGLAPERVDAFVRALVRAVSSSR